MFAAQAWLSACIIFPVCAAAAIISPLFDWRRMRPPTIVALLWGRLALLTMGVRPKVEGEDLLPPPGEPVVFVANHCSYLDIPITNFIPRLCKVRGQDCSAWSLSRGRGFRPTSGKRKAASGLDCCLFIQPSNQGRAPSNN